MRRPILMLTLLATVVALPALAASPRLTAQGWGKLRIGMRERDAVRIFHLRVPIDDAASFDCRENEMPGHEGLYVMAERGVITRITIAGPSQLRTDRGLGIGSTEDEVKRAYGRRLKIATAPYEDEPAHQLIAWSRKSGRGVRYDTNVAGAVNAIFVGNRTIEYIEGCL